MKKNTVTKLARDNMREITAAKNFAATFYIADQKEYVQRLREKLLEEVHEYLEDNTVIELADIMEVIYALANIHNISSEELEKIRRKKAMERGGFKQRLIINYERP